MIGEVDFASVVLFIKHIGLVFQTHIKPSPGIEFSIEILQLSTLFSPSLIYVMETCVLCLL